MSGRFEFDPWLTPEAKIFIQQRLLLIQRGSPGLYKFAVEYCPGILSLAEDQSRRAIQLFVNKWQRNHPNKPIVNAFGFMSALNCRHREKEKKKRRFTRWGTRIARALSGRRSGPRKWLDSDALAWLADELISVYPVILIRMMIDSPNLVQAIYRKNKEVMREFVDSFERGPMAMLITSKELCLRAIVTTFAKKLNVRDYPYDIPHLLVECKVNGHKVRALIDTGAMTSLIPSKLAYSCGLPAYQLITDNLGRTTGIGSYDIIGKFRNASLQVGNFITVIDMNVSERGRGYLVVGMEFLRKHKCQVSCRLDAVLFPKNDQDKQVDHPCRHRLVVHQIVGSDIKQSGKKSKKHPKTERKRRASFHYWDNTSTRNSSQLLASSVKMSSVDWLTYATFVELEQFFQDKQVKYLKPFLKSQLPWLKSAVAKRDKDRICQFIDQWQEYRRQTDSSVPDIVSALDFLVFVDELYTTWMKKIDESYSWLTHLAFAKIRHSFHFGKHRYLRNFIEDVLPNLAYAIRYSTGRQDIQAFVDRHELTNVNQFFEGLLIVDAKSRSDQIKGTDDSLSFHTANESIDWLAPQSIDEIKQILEEQPDLSRYLDYEEPEVAWAVQNQASEEIQEFAGRMAQSRPELPIVDGLDTFFKVLVELKSKWKPEESSYAWLTLDAFKAIFDSIRDYQNLALFVTKEFPEITLSIQKQTEEEIPHFIGLLAQNKLWRIKSVKDFLIKLWDRKEELDESARGASIVEVSSSLGWLTSETMKDLADNLGTEDDRQNLIIRRPDVIAALDRNDVLWMRQFVRQLEYWANRRLDDEHSFQCCLSEYLWVRGPPILTRFIRRIVLSCRVNGRELNGLVDSGATSLIGLTQLVRCGIATTKIDTNIEGVVSGLQSVGGMQVGKVYDIPLEIKGFRVPDIHMAVMDPYDLDFFLIGRDYLKVNNVEVFCRERKISIPFPGNVTFFYADDQA